jgi:hypothetical protein
MEQINFKKILDKNWTGDRFFEEKIIDAMKEACLLAVDMFACILDEDSNNDYHHEIADEIKKQIKL